MVTNLKSSNSRHLFCHISLGRISKINLSAGQQAPWSLSGRFVSCFFQFSFLFSWHSMTYCSLGRSLYSSSNAHIFSWSSLFFRLRIFSIVSTLFIQYTCSYSFFQIWSQFRWLFSEITIPVSIPDQCSNNNSNPTLSFQFI